MIVRMRSKAAVRQVIFVVVLLVAVFGPTACSRDESRTPPTIHDFVMPNLVGESWADAEPRLRANGWTGTIVKGSDIPTGEPKRGQIMSQSPGAGEVVQIDVQITLRFGF